MCSVSSAVVMARIADDLVRIVLVIIAITPRALSSQRKIERKKSNVNNTSRTAKDRVEGNIF